MASRASPPPLWRLSEVKFGDVLRQQDWGTTIGTILIPIVILAVVGGTSSLNEQPFSLADTTIAYPDLCARCCWRRCLVLPLQRTQ